MKEIPQLSWIESAINSYAPAIAGNADQEHSVEMYETDRYSFRRRKRTLSFRRKDKSKRKSQKMSRQKEKSRKGTEVDRVTQAPTDKYDVWLETSYSRLKMKRERSTPTYAGWSFSPGAYPVVNNLVPLGLFDNDTRHDIDDSNELKDVPKLLRVYESEVSALTVPSVLEHRERSFNSMFPVSTHFVRVGESDLSFATLTTASEPEPWKSHPIKISSVQESDISFTTLTIASKNSKRSDDSSSSEISFVTYEKSTDQDDSSSAVQEETASLDRQMTQELKARQRIATRLSRRLKLLFPVKNSDFKDGVVDTDMCEMVSHGEEDEHHHDVVESEASQPSTPKDLDTDNHDDDDDLYETAVEENTKTAASLPKSTRFSNLFRKRRQDGQQGTTIDSELYGVDGNEASCDPAPFGKSRIFKMFQRKKSQYNRAGVVDSELDTDSDLTESKVLSSQESLITEHKSRRFKTFTFKPRNALIRAFQVLRMKIYEEEKAEQLAWEIVDTDQIVQLLRI